MNCVVDQSIFEHTSQGKSLQALKSYLKKKYNLKIDEAILKKRLSSIRTQL